jgi:alpha-tubulin suppressor-like RCC1 family protein
MIFSASMVPATSSTSSTATYSSSASTSSSLSSSPSSSASASPSPSVPPPSVVTSQFSFISSGLHHSCGIAVSPPGVAYCWGSDYYGQLGTGLRADQLSPGIAVSGGLVFSSIAASFYHTCGIVVSPPGAAYCWGSNSYGALGDGTTTDSAFPVAVSGGLAFSSIATGRDHSCGIVVTPPGAAYCWGSNGYGQLARDDGTTADSASPVAVGGGLVFSSIATGYLHTCGIVVSPPGAAYCWGFNGNAQLGDGTYNSPTSPVAVIGGLTFSSIVTGYVHTCGIVISPPGAAYCWGNDNGQLGDGTTSESDDTVSPVAVSGGLAFSSIAAGGLHTCGIVVSPPGAAYCWGRNSNGQLGAESPAYFSISFVAVTGGLMFSSITTSSYHTCGIIVSPPGAAYCWGSNDFGQLGDGTYGERSYPVAVLAPPPVSSSASSSASASPSPSVPPVTST